jgi:hypothetical protein
MYIYIYICVCVCVCRYLCIIFIYIYFLYMGPCIHLHACIHTKINTQPHCIHIKIHTHTHCLYVYAYTQTHISIHIHTRICIHVFLCTYSFVKVANSYLGCGSALPVIIPAAVRARALHARPGSIWPVHPRKRRLLRARLWVYVCMCMYVWQTWECGISVLKMFYTCVFANVYTYAFVYNHMHECIYMYIYIYSCVWVCVFMQWAYIYSLAMYVSVACAGEWTAP